MLSTLDNITPSSDLIRDIADNIYKLAEFVNIQLNDTLLMYFKRTRKLTPEILMYIICIVNSSSNSYHTVLDKLNNDNIVNIKEQSVNEKLQQINYIDIENINNKVRDYIYPGKKHRYIAVDCVRVHLYESLNKDGIPKSQNNTCATAIVSSMIDVETNIPINYHVHIGSNERDAFRAQMKYVNRDTDTLIFDRGYFSEMFYHELITEKINGIFRLKGNLLFIREFKTSKENSMITNITIGKIQHTIRIIKYYVGDIMYIMGTTRKNFTVDDIQELYTYKKRWGKIETQYNFAKGILSLNNIKSKSLNRVRQDLAIHQFILTLCFYIHKLIYNRIDYTSEKKINTTSSLNILSDSILKVILLNNTVKKNINSLSINNNLLKCLYTIITSTAPVIKNRHFERISKKPIKKFKFKKSKQDNILIKLPVNTDYYATVFDNTVINNIDINLKNDKNKNNYINTKKSKPKQKKRVTGIPIYIDV